MSGSGMEPEVSAMLLELGRALRTRRRFLRVGQERLGIRAKSSQCTISAVETGRGGALSVETIARLAAGLGMELRLVPSDAMEASSGGAVPWQSTRPTAFSIPARLRRDEAE